MSTGSRRPERFAFVISFHLFLGQRTYVFLFLQALLLMTAEDEEQLMDCWYSIAHHQDITHSVSVMKGYLDLWHLTPFYDPQAIILAV